MSNKVEEALKWAATLPGIADEDIYALDLAAEVRRLREVEKALRDEIERARARNEDWNSDL